ncbi:MAG: protein jag [Spirochaetaceae bacterium]|jgi:spoIIIJ-associated protein|nr:protein jag [Spirochaetaceae bacterium]
MVYQFEGKTEKEAIANAARELGLEKDKFDVEIIETQKGGLFKKGLVRIEVHADEIISKNSGDRYQVSMNGLEGEGSGERAGGTKTQVIVEEAPLSVENDFEKAMIEFVSNVIEKMGYDVTVTIQFREKNKLGLKIASRHSPIIIGKKGKNLDALQLVANIYAGRVGKPEVHVVLDSENYRLRREESIVRMAYDVADRVRANRSSLLLEPMNPFERRLVHTTLSDIKDIATRSEGEGMYKQVRVSYRGAK